MSGGQQQNLFFSDGDESIIYSLNWLGCSSGGFK